MFVFNTGDTKIMEILSGELQVLLAGSDAWQAVQGGDSFKVPINSSFDVKIITATDYCCSFLK